MSVGHETRVCSCVMQHVICRMLKIIHAMRQIVRFEWKSDFIAAGDAFFQGGQVEHVPRPSRTRRHRLPTHSTDGDIMLYGQELAPYLYRRMDARVRPLLKKMPERDCHLITQVRCA